MVLPCFFLLIVMSEAFCAFAPPLYADTFAINGGGTVEGRLLDPNKRPYQLETAKGIVLGVDPQIVGERIRETQNARAAYRDFAPLESDTVENHFKIAEWCTEHYLSDLAKLHYNRILELDPENAPARGKLGYIKDKTTGEWTTGEQKMESRGYVQYKGRWRLPQEIWVEEQRGSRKKSEFQWKQDLKKILSVSDPEKGKRAFLEIRDPAAVGPILDLLNQEKSPDTCILYIRALSQIGTGGALKEIAQRFMTESHEEVARECLEQIRRHPESIPTAGAIFGGYLRVSSDGVAKFDADTISRAARGIGEIGDRGAVPALIEALITRHKEVQVIGSEKTSASFNSSGGTTFGQGQTAVTSFRDSENEEVLNALKKLTGANFRYDRDAWRGWLRESQKPPTFSTRRGD